MSNTKRGPGQGQHQQEDKAQNSEDQQEAANMKEQERGLEQGKAGRAVTRPRPCESFFVICWLAGGGEGTCPAPHLVRGRGRGDPRGREGRGPQGRQSLEGHCFRFSFQCTLFIRGGGQGSRVTLIKKLFYWFGFVRRVWFLSRRRPCSLLGRLAGSAHSPLRVHPISLHSL